MSVPLQGTVAVAQQVKQADRGKDASKDPAAAQRAYAAGVRASEKGDAGETVKQLSVALAMGGLPNAQMAKALYLRGAAYRQQGKSARAISDLTTALWLKNGLGEPDRTKASEARAAACQDAGLGTPPPIGSPAVAAPAKAAPASPAQPKPTPGAQVATAPAQSTFWNFLPNLVSSGSTSPQQPPAPAAAPVQAQAPVASQPPPPAPVPQVSAAPAAAPVAPQVTVPGPVAAAQQPGPLTSSWETSTNTASSSVAFANVEQPSTSAAQPSLAPATPATGAASGASNPVVGFFSNLFGGGSSSGSQATTQASSAVETGSTGGGEGGSSNWSTGTTAAVAPQAPAVSPQLSVPRVSAVPGPSPVANETLPWAGQNAAPTPSPAPPSSPAVVAAAPVTAVPAPTTAALAPAPEPRRPKREIPVVTGAGAYKLQVAVVKSREEAEQLARALQGYPAVQNGTLRPEVDEQVYGGMGKFYRVRLGPYANAIEPNELCKGLRPQGYDCVVVTR